LRALLAGILTVTHEPPFQLRIKPPPLVPPLPTAQQFVELTQNTDQRLLVVGLVTLAHEEPFH
jgi:hypothetical protein